MPFEKGREKSGGREVGTPNKAVKELRQQLQTVIQTVLDELPGTLAAMEPTDWAKFLTALLTGTATSKQIADFRKSQEPINLTLHLGDYPFEQEVNEPSYHIEIYSDGTTKCYDRYTDGRIEYRNN